MATKNMKKPVKEDKVFEAVADEMTEVTTAKKTTKKAKEFQNGDMIPCRSVTAGEMFCAGKKSGILYKWANQGSVEEVRYEDLVYMRDSRSTFLFNPRFIIEDMELVDSKGWEKVRTVYDNMFTQRDIEEILNLPLPQFTATLKQVPTSVQNTLKIVVTEKIEDGTFDSIGKIKAVDAAFDSDLMCLVK